MVSSGSSLAAAESTRLEVGFLVVDQYSVLFYGLGYMEVLMLLFGIM
jgi:hypothetical protein